MTMFEEFIFWISSIVEDNPIPYEIKHAYFILDLSNNYSILTFAGSEEKQNPLFNYEYLPLDAYNFANQSFMEIKDIYLAKITTKELVEQALEMQEFKNIFTKKQIYICQKHKEIEYSFSLKSK